MSTNIWPKALDQDLNAEILPNQLIKGIDTINQV